jgi:hypothetical protein
MLTRTTFGLADLACEEPEDSALEELEGFICNEPAGFSVAGRIFWESAGLVPDEAITGWLVSALEENQPLSGGSASRAQADSERQRTHPKSKHLFIPHLLWLSYHRLRKIASDAKIAAAQL